MNPIRIIIVDDHDVIRTGLVSYLSTQEDFVVVGDTSSGKAALDLLETIEADVAIMDITMPEMDGMQATRLLKQRFPDTKVLVLTVHEDKEYFFAMLAAGASGYITKASAADTLLEALHSVAMGHVYLQPSLARWLLDSYHLLSTQQGMSMEEEELEDHPDLAVLSGREVEVLELVAAGLTSATIAEELDISPNTVSRHRERIMKKLNLHNVSDLTRFAIRVGLIQP